ncbi:DNA-processing protein DprA [Frankia sp. Mgl5]|nr:DNA-processing protein DprA [Frankia sp. Mgl5]
MRASPSPDTRDRSRRNTARHRLLATLTHTTLVCESAPGGAGIAVAQAARTLGRPVLALPRPGNSDSAQELLRGGLAHPATTAADITAHLPHP